jgi:hypothetical protein
MKTSGVLTAIVTLCLFPVGPVVSAQDDPREGRNCPCRVITDPIDGWVKLVDRDGFTIKVYPGATHKDTLEIYQTQDQFYVLRSSYFVYVYEIATGKPVRQYMANKKWRNWVR